MGCGTEMLFGDFDCSDNTIFLHYYCTPVDTLLTQPGSLSSSSLQPIGIIEHPKLEWIGPNNHRVEGASLISSLCTVGQIEILEMSVVLHKI